MVNLTLKMTFLHLLWNMHMAKKSQMMKFWIWRCLNCSKRLVSSISAMMSQLFHIHQIRWTSFVWRICLTKMKSSIVSQSSRSCTKNKNRIKSSSMYRLKFKILNMTKMKTLKKLLSKWLMFQIRCWQMRLKQNKNSLL